MSDFENKLPDDLRGIADRLRSERVEATGLELDTIKTRAMAKASASSRRKGFAVRSRGMAAALTFVLMAAGTGGVLAGGHEGNDNGSAAESEYHEGKGCGDRNHEHARHDECGDHHGGGGDEGDSGGGGGHHGD